jgi:hypothetical protein
MEVMPMPDRAARHAAASAARGRFEARKRRTERARRERASSLAAEDAASAERKKRQTIAKALERARLRLQSRDR